MEPDDSEGAVRSADARRPPGLQGIDSKAIAVANNHRSPRFCLAGPTSDSADSFAAGNSRPMRLNWTGVPAKPLLALGSPASRGLPFSRCHAMVKGLFAGACALTVGEGEWTVLFPIESGIMQGCLLSGLLYATMMLPPLRAVADGLVADDGGGAKACADDLGAALTALASLKALRRPFALAAGGIGVDLRPDKCRLVTLASWADPRTIHRIRRWMADNIPERARFEIADRGT